MFSQGRWKVARTGEQRRKRPEKRKEENREKKRRREEEKEVPFLLEWRRGGIGHAVRMRMSWRPTAADPAVLLHCDCRSAASRVWATTWMPSMPRQRGGRRVYLRITRPMREWMTVNCG